MANYEQFKRGLIQQESGHDYSAVNKRTGALGFGQVMPQNLVGWGANAGKKNFGWDYDALGRDVSPQEFLANPALQEKIVDHQLRQAYQKHGAEGAARWWYSNSPNPSNKRPAKGEPTPNEYAMQVLGKTGGGSGGSGGGGKMTANAGTGMQDRIAKAKAAGYTDDQIFQSLAKNQDYSARFEKAKAAGYSQEQIAGKLGLKFGAASNKKQFTPMDVNAEGKRVLNEKLKEAGPVSRAQSAVLGVGETVGGGLLQGATFLSDGFNGAVNKALGTNLDTNNYERFTNKFEGAKKTLEQQRAANGQTGIDGARLVGNIAATLPLAVAGGVGATVASAAARGAGTGLAIGAGSFAKDAGQRATNTAFGGVGGAIGGAVGQKVTQGVVRGVNAVKGRLNPAAQEIDDLGKQYGVRTSVGDAGGNPHVQGAEVQLEKVPLIGTASFRAAQQKEVAGAAAAITEKMQKNMQIAGYKQLDDIQKAAASGDRNAARIVGIINDAGNDTSKVIQAGAEVRLWREKNIARQLYDVAGNIAKTQGGAVAPTKTAQTLTSKIDEIKASLAPDDALHTDLAKIQTRLNDPNIVKDYANMRLLRSQLGSMAEKYAANGTNPNQAAAGFLGDLRSAVENDISNYAASSGNSALKNAYSRADSFYKSALKNRDSNIAKVLKSDKPDEIYTQFIQAGKGDRAANFYRNLDPKAQSALRAEMVARAVDKATKQNGGIFSPATFAGEFDRLRAPYSQIFKGADKAEMDGFVKLMRHVERAGQYAENPANGSRAVPLMMGAAGATTAIASPIAAAGGAGGIYGLSKLFTTAIGKKILLSASDLPPGSAGLDNLLKMTQSLTTTTGANTGKK